jgi:5-carboxymethyl-2-hydroxymuconate isomerase
MRFVTYEHRGERRVGYLADGGVVPLDATDMRGFIERGEPARAAGDAVSADRILAPVQPSKILCIGYNYRSHLSSDALPTRPDVFAKLPSAVIGPDDTIVIPTPDADLDYEGEIGVVIGRRARKVSTAGALDVIFGYTIVHDVSARAIQFENSQITLSKGLDTFCPMGPSIVTPDEFGPTDDVRLRTFVNGRCMQDASTADWVFSVAEIIEFITRNVTLKPGDVIAMGTPTGTGFEQDPQAYLRPGDEVRIEVPQVGELVNAVAMASESTTEGPDGVRNT